MKPQIIRLRMAESELVIASAVLPGPDFEPAIDNERAKRELRSLLLPL
jgi:hypothetical protein